jgi:hypothetical protein
MSVLSWARALASLHDFALSYRSRVCLPGSAVSIRLEYFPTFSGNLLSAFSFDFWMLNREV